MRLTAKPDPKTARSKKHASQKRHKAALTTSPTLLALAAPDLPRSRSTGSSSGERKGFLDLPAELRNEIYALSLPKNKVVNINDGWPNILFTDMDILSEDKKIFHEALPIFLSSNTFGAHIKDCRDAVLTGWLGFVGKMSEEQKACITTLSITFSGNILDWDKPNGCYEPDFDYWCTFITRLKPAGLTATQLSFPGIRPLALATLPIERATLDALIQPYLLHNFVLKPLLKHHDLFDPTNPPRNIYDQVVEEFEALGLTRRQADIVLASVKYDVRDAKRGAPGRWFEGWVAEGEQQREDMREEGRAMKKERLGRGKKGGGGTKGGRGERQVASFMKMDAWAWA